jgi:hypothetical protein
MYHYYYYYDIICIILQSVGRTFSGSISFEVPACRLKCINTSMENRRADRTVIELEIIFVDRPDGNAEETFSGQFTFTYISQSPNQIKTYFKV